MCLVSDTEDPFVMEFEDDVDWSVFEEYSSSERDQYDRQIVTVDRPDSAIFICVQFHTSEPLLYNYFIQVGN